MKFTYQTEFSVNTIEAENTTQLLNELCASVKFIDFEYELNHLAFEELCLLLFDESFEVQDVNEPLVFEVDDYLIILRLLEEGLVFTKITDSYLIKRFLKF